MSYQGHKFFCTDEKIVYNEWGERVIKPIFRMTKQYIEYCKRKEEEKRQYEIRCLKESLEYQMKTYGEVDKYDYQRYVSMVQKLYNK